MHQSRFAFFELVCVMTIFATLIPIVVVGHRRVESRRANPTMSGGHNLRAIGLAALQYSNGSYFPRQGR
ncbi:MAG TPA: hypothetical protein VFF73_38320 [Planctomycetota bacterium]|nr:hypothetical protein [Planctomycetota bacterium]